jgi:hypothetical protein
VLEAKFWVCGGASSWKWRISAFVRVCLLEVYRCLFGGDADCRF